MDPEEPRFESNPDNINEVSKIKKKDIELPIRSKIKSPETNYRYWIYEVRYKNTISNRKNMQNACHIQNFLRLPLTWRDEEIENDLKKVDQTNRSWTGISLTSDDDDYGFSIKNV